MNASDVLSICALMLSGVSAWSAYRATRRAHAVSAYDRSTDLFLEVDKALIDHPHLRPYFYDGKRLTENDPDRPGAEAIAELMLDVFEWIWYRQRELSAKDSAGWRGYILEMLDTSPVLCEYHARNPGWHPSVDNLLQARNAGLRLGDAAPADGRASGATGI